MDGGAEVYNFNNPTGQLVIDSLAGSDTVTINALDGAFDADISVVGSGGGGND